MKCLYCGERLDGCANIYGGSNIPEPGDVAMCLYCGHLMGFTVDGMHRELTSKEMHEIAGDPRILRAQRARMKAIKEKKEM